MNFISEDLIFTTQNITFATHVVIMQDNLNSDVTQFHLLNMLIFMSLYMSLMQ